MATVFESSDPVSMMRRHSGMISVVRRNVIVGEELLLLVVFCWLLFALLPVLLLVLGVLGAFGPPLVAGFKVAVDEGSFFTRAPMTPRLVRRRYSNGRDLEVVLRKG